MPQLTAALRGKVADALNRAALSTEAEAKQLAPVDTGLLRNSIQATKTATKADLKSETSVAAEYGVYVELGTVHQSAQPFISPAFEIAGRELKDELNDVFK